jgi:2-oxoglutarate dehydrogenase complex dehydrogenase (E1) component-like enzyme
MHDYVWAQEEPKNMGGQLYVNEFRFSKMEISFKGMQHQPREVKSNAVMLML